MAKQRARYTKGTIKARALQSIFANENQTLAAVAKSIGCTLPQTRSAVGQLRKGGEFPTDSKWAASRKGGKPSISVTQDEIVTIAEIGVEKTREILRLLTKLRRTGA